MIVICKYMKNKMQSNSTEKKKTCKESINQFKYYKHHPKMKEWDKSDIFGKYIGMLKQNQE